MPSDGEFSSAHRWWIVAIMVAIPVLMVLALRGHPNYLSSTNTLTLPIIEEVRLTRGVDIIDQPVELPYSVDGFAAETLKFHIVVTYADNESGVFWVVPDDCVDGFSVNATKVELPDAVKQHRCDWQEGFRIDLKPYLHNGKNDIDFAIYNVKGKTGLSFEPILK